MSKYRPIVPVNESFRTAASSSDNQSTPDHTPGAGNVLPAEAKADLARRRRRPTGQVSHLACLECRKARAKCDGDKPGKCSRCSSRGLKCFYQPHTKSLKDDILIDLDNERTKSDSLAKQNRSMTSILDVLINSGHADEVIRRLRSKTDMESVINWLRTQPDLHAHMEHNKESELALTDAVQRVEQMYIALDTYEPAIQWTKVTANQSFINRLFEEYFQWVHPVHMLFSEINFLDCYMRGDTSYCSGCLVNAVCAMACSFLATTSEEHGLQGISDLAELQNSFLSEARASIGQKDFSKITTLQTFAVMFLVDLGAGRASNATTYLRCAADNLMEQDSSALKDEVFEASRWGIHTLNTWWSAFTYQRPFNPESPDSDPTFNIHDPDTTPYFPHRMEHVESTNRRPAFAIKTAAQMARLFRIVHAGINMYCGARGRVRPAAFLALYDKISQWKHNLPKELALDVEAKPLVHVLTLHLCYFTARMELFLPLIVPFGDNPLSAVFVKHVLDNARSGAKILHQAMNMGYCQYLMPLAVHCLLHICDTIAKCSPDIEERCDAALLCTRILEQNRRNFRAAGPLLQMFRFQIEEYGVELPEDIMQKLGASDVYSVNEILDAAGRLSYVQPTKQMIKWIHRDFADEWPGEWTKYLSNAKLRRYSGSSGRSSDDGQARGRSLRVDEMLNS